MKCGKSLNSSLIRKGGVLVAFAVLLVICGCQSPTRAGGTLRFHMEADSMRERTGSTVFIVLPVSESAIRIGDLPVFVEADISSVNVVRVDLGLCLVFQFQPMAQRSLYRLSGERQGRRIVLVYNGQPLGARLFEGVIESGMLFMFIEVDDARLPDLAQEMNDILNPPKKSPFARTATGH